MKKHRILALILALVMAVALAACGDGTATPTPGTSTPAPDNSGSSTPDPAPVDDGEKYVLTYSYFGPEVIGPGLFMSQLAEEIAEETNGRLTFDTFYNGTLLKTSDVISGCINGTADIVVVDSSIVGEVFPLNNVFSMPFLNTPPSKNAMDAAYMQLLVDCPELGEELSKQGLMWLNIGANGGFHLHGVSTMYSSPSTLAGSTIDGLGEGGNLITALGGNGVTMDPGDWYLSLSTGLLDGQLMHFAAMRGFATDELLTTHVIFANIDDPTEYEDMFGGGLYAPISGYIMNTDSFNSLPADLQELLTTKMLDYAVFCTDEFNMPHEVIPSIDICIERGDEFIFVGDEEREEWVYGMEVVLEKWYAQCESAGYDGKAVYDHLLDLFEAYA